MKFSHIVLLLAATALATSCGSSKRYPGIQTEKQLTRTGSGLGYVDIIEGAGASPKAGKPVTVHYTGFLMDSTKFDSSVDRNEPLTFVIGVGQVIKGWDEGVKSMKVGGKRKLVIPYQLAYGDYGMPGVIPARADLVFDVELLNVGE